ncbi:MAG TPA: glycosyltransferase [Oligoflexia bacterium]|nr:glycosyltransferase [Oligoflexia bacterium]
MKNRQILLVSYFFEPLQTVAAERWARFCAGLKKRGLDLHVLAGPWKSGDTDSSRDIEYLDDPVSEDSGKYKTGFAPTSGFRSTMRKLIPLFLLIDGKWFWSLRVFLKVIQRRHSTSVLIVTGTPWSSVVAAALAARVSSLPYIVDFRDLWATEPFLRSQSALARRYFAWLERWVVRGAMSILTVNDPLTQYFQNLDTTKKVVCIPNGFSGELHYNEVTFNSMATAQTHLLYGGSISGHSGVAEFLKAFDLAQVPVDLAFMGTDFLGVLPHPHAAHIPQVSGREAEMEMARAGVLLLTLHRKSVHYVTGKLMSYLKAGRPILYWGPLESPAAKIVRECGVGWVIANDDLEGLKRALTEINERFHDRHSFAFAPNLTQIREYSVDRMVERIEREVRLSFGIRRN